MELLQARPVAEPPGHPPLANRARRRFRDPSLNQPSTIGTFVSSGCIPLTNEDVMDLCGRVRLGTRVVVLPGRPPAIAAATTLAPPTQPIRYCEERPATLVLLRLITSSYVGACNGRSAGFSAAATSPWRLPR